MVLPSLYNPKKER